MSRAAITEAARRLSGWLRRARLSRDLDRALADRRRARDARQAAARKGEATKFRNRVQALKLVKGDHRDHHA
ncbi:hypothetical protein ACNFJ7_02105 [Sphingomonas sp. HT-1]|uniref:hypothetical protein n=1 Tax=unclassified Sphingomonas TaxID=196159 RepID=UPI0003805D43|nr:MULTISPECIES: hypothetical protein [unclassified Sphingomonas]KTF68663.1 hypothetical protein ATB93_13135 [Sphingomonas sp. WG]